MNDLSILSLIATCRSMHESHFLSQSPHLIVLAHWYRIRNAEEYLYSNFQPIGKLELVWQDEIICIISFIAPESQSQKSSLNQVWNSTKHHSPQAAYVYIDSQSLNVFVNLSIGWDQTFSWQGLYLRTSTPFWDSVSVSFSVIYFDSIQFQGSKYLRLSFL